MSLRPYLVVVAALAMTGCNQAADKDPTQVDSELNPNYRQAQQDLDNKNPQGAVADYEAALAANPKLAGAHYELGVIYGDDLNDPVSAIYHFKRFLELSPSTDKKEQVQTLIDKESQAYVASLPNSTPQISPDDMNKLTAENTALKKQVDDANATIVQLQSRLKHRGIAADVAAPPTAPAADTATTDAPATPPGPKKALPVDQAVAAKGDADSDAAAAASTTATTASGAPPAGARSYTVARGDSYWKIAKKMYPGDTKNGVQKIQDANKQTIGKPLKIGQVLVIP